MEKRIASLVLLLFFMFFATGCAGVPDQESKPTVAPPPPPQPRVVVNKRWFFEGTMFFDTEGPATQIMENIEKIEPTRLSMKRSKKGVNAPSVKDIDPNELEQSIYALYLDADTDKNHRITQKEAEAYFDLYQHQFDALVGPVRF